MLQAKFEKEDKNKMLPHLCSHSGSLPSNAGSMFQGVSAPQVSRQGV